MQSVWTDVTITAARTEDLPEIFALLEECDLPREGLADHVSTTLLARKRKEIVGCAALELYQEHALLRSVAVKSAFRNQGIALRLTRRAFDLAKEYQVRNVYLLTETAREYFTRQGFVQVQRSDVPENVKRSVEFTTLCPDSATVMMKSLV
jgi:amino-acid N-acetyltransferase